jgi:hypothetical protein
LLIKAKSKKMAIPLIHTFEVSKKLNEVNNLIKTHFINKDNVVIDLKENKKKTEIKITFTNQPTYISHGDQTPFATNKEKHQQAKFIQETIRELYNVVKKPITLESISLYAGIDLGMSCTFYLQYPQLLFELKHNLPGPNFMEEGNRFVAKFVLTIYDKILHGKYGVSLKQSTFYTSEIILKGEKTIDGITIYDRSFMPNTEKNVIELLPEYIKEFEVWINKYAERNKETSILNEFTNHLIDTIQTK